MGGVNGRGKYERPDNARIEPAKPRIGLKATIRVEQIQDRARVGAD